MTPLKQMIARAERMTPEDAKEYLLGALEQVSWVGQGGTHPTDTVRTTKTRRLILRLLFDANGRTLDYDYILNAISAHKGADERVCDKKLIQVNICHLRRDIATEPYRIRLQWGVGYFLEHDAPAKQSVRTADFFPLGGNSPQSVTVRSGGFSFGGV